MALEPECGSRHRIHIYIYIYTVQGGIIPFGMIPKRWQVNIYIYIQVTFKSDKGYQGKEGDMEVGPLGLNTPNPTFPCNSLNHKRICIV